MAPGETAAPAKRKVVVLLCGVAAGAAALAYTGIADRAKGMQEVEAWTEKQPYPRCGWSRRSAAPATRI